MHVANTFRRITAHATDELIGSLFWIPLLVSIWKLSREGSEVILSWQWIGGLWIAKMTYEVLCLYVLQALPAQHFFGLKIMSTHRPELGLGLGQVIIRVLVAQLKYVFGPAIYFMALFHRQRQHLDDILAETQVVQFNDRAFEPKVRFVLGSVLVYFSLVTNLSKNMDLVSSGMIQREGIAIQFSQSYLKTISAPQ